MKAVFLGGSMIGNRRSLAVLMVAVAFIFQSVLAMANAAGMPIGPQFDQFGNPLCITSQTGDDGSSQPDGHKLPNCCTYGCNLLPQPITAPPLLSAGILRPLAIYFQPLDITAAALPAPVERSPANPRAPPLNA